MMPLALQPASFDIWDKKYRLRDSSGDSVDSSEEASRDRVALALASVEKPKLRKRFFTRFRDAMDTGCIPAGRIYSNAGAEAYKRSVSLINCLGGDTPVLTRSGPRLIRNLARKGLPVEVLNGNGRWVSVMFKSYGEQETVGLQFKGLNKQKIDTVRATLGHRWVLSSGKVITTEYWLTGGSNSRHIRINHLRAPRPSTKSVGFEQGLLHGLIYGDGTRTSFDSKQGYLRFQLDLVGQKIESFSSLVESITGITPLSYTNSLGVHRFPNIELDLDAKALPPKSVDKDYLAGFFAGVLGTDGCIPFTSGESKRKSSTVIVYGKKELTSFLYAMMPTIGVSPISHGLMGGGDIGDTTNFGPRKSAVWMVTFNPSTISPKLILNRLHRNNFYVGTDCLKTSTYWTYQGSDEEYKLEEVFCCEEPETQSFVLFNGLLTGNCVVSDTIEDSMDSILSKLYEAGMTLKAGCGIGYEFSTLRPKGSFVHGAGAATSGPLSFMDVYDKSCFTVASAGGRRGAQMGTFDISHPDVLDFIKAKREDGRLRQFNMSILITDEFIRAVRSDADWVFKWNGVPSGKPMRAQALWDTIMESTYNFAEPGFILVDRINHFNNLWFCENLRATNPCGEQPLPPYGSCLLGSINLTSFVVDPFAPTAYFDFQKFENSVSIFTRMLDNVVELSGLPLPRQRFEIETKRRHGMGFLGLGSALTMLGMVYGDPASILFTEKVTRQLALIGFLTGTELAQEKGEAPVLTQSFRMADLRGSPNAAFNSNFRGLSTDGTGSVVGRDLFLQSHYFDNWRDIDDGRSVLKELEKHGSRFTHHSSIAPTGTISLSMGNNCSNGIEPTFSHFYTRNVIREGRNAKEAVPVYSYEFLLYQSLVADGTLGHTVDPQVAKEMVSLGLDPTIPHPDHMPREFSTTDSIIPADHVAVQAAAQKWIDSSISKTINVPSDYPLEDFKHIYMQAYDSGLKGATTFRFNPEAFSGVLVKAGDLKNTRYTFVLASGEEKSYSGDTLIEYEGQTHTAANLFDALKEGYYSKF